MSEFKRKCYICNKDLFYKSFKSFYNANWANNACRSCVQKGKTAWNKGLTKETNSKVASYAIAMKNNWEKNPRDTWNKGLTALTDSRVKDNNEKTTVSLLKSYKENKIMPWNKGKPFPRMAGENSPSKRPEVRLKLRKALLEIYKDKNPRCNFNAFACKLFDEINLEMGWNGIHALNGGEFRIKELGYFPDFYEPNLNIVIEYYEKFHNKTMYKKADTLRQEKIMTHLKCNFYIIKQG